VIVLASSALAMLEGIATHGASPLRTLLVVWFLAVAPGLAVVGLLRLRDPWLEVALVPALSLSIDVIVGGILSYTRLWSPAAGILILVAISVAGAFVQDVVPRRPKPGSTDSRGASPPWAAPLPDRPDSKGVHPEDARPIDHGRHPRHRGIHDDRWIEAKPGGQEP
jgi:hypothetical protein